MTFKLTKEENLVRLAHVVALAAKREALDDAMRTYNDIMTGARNAVDEAIADYNIAIAEANGFVGDIAQAWENEFEEKTEKWQEGQRGSEARELIEAWQSFRTELDEIDIDFPEELTVDLAPLDESLDDLATEQG